jgi:hypothetical protein
MSDTADASVSARAPRLKQWWQRWVTLLDERESGAAVALMRIGVGLSLLVLLVPFVLTDAGRDVVVFSFADDDVGGYRNLGGTRWMNALGGPTPAVLHALLLAVLLASVCIVVGVFGRLPVLVAAVCTRLVFLQNGDVSGGGDALLGNALFLLLLADCTHTLSLDCRLRTGRFVDDTPVMAWPRRLALVQLSIVYTTTGLQKLVSTAWTPFDGFSALYQILQSPQWTRFPHLIDDAHGWLVVPAMLGSAITIVWEVFFFAVLLRPRWRPVFALTGLALHIGIAVLMEVGIFSWLSLALYPAMFPVLAAQVERQISLRTSPHTA